MSTPSPADLLACAVEAARAAGHHAVKNESRRGEVAQSLAHDVKLNLDTECQRKAEAVIRNAFPNHAMLGEEGASDGDASGPLWIIDPIDGTVNFSHGLTYWCSSIAVQVDELSGLGERDRRSDDHRDAGRRGPFHSRSLWSIAPPVAS